MPVELSSGASVELPIQQSIQLTIEAAVDSTVDSTAALPIDLSELFEL